MAKISINDKNCKYAVMDALLALIESDKTAPIMLCIGSQRVAGDILGPLVGDMLVNQYNVNAFVYGTLNRPITALNLVTAHDFIKKFHPESKILAIDAALGDSQARGIITINRDGIVPGAAVSRQLPKIGDYSITANVSVFGKENYSALKKARVGEVYSFAEAIAFGINDALSIKRGLQLYA